MKRSSHMSLVLLGSVSMAATLSGCSEAPQSNVAADPGGTFANMAECVAIYDQETCAAAEKLAKQEHLANAPHYSTRDSCIAEYGADMCQPASNYGGSGNVWMPLMIGYMMGSANSVPAPMYYGPGAYRHRNDRNYSAPIYTSGSGYSRSAPIGTAPYSYGKSSVSTKGSLKSSTAMTPPSSTRGGFGTSFKPTSSFRSSYIAANPSLVGKSSYSSASSSGFKSSSSVSSRGGFGSSARSFGGGFGG